MRFGPAGLAVAVDSVLTPVLVDWHNADDYTAELRVRPDALSQGFPLQTDYAYAGISDPQQKIAFLAVAPSQPWGVRVGYGSGYTGLASSVALPANPGATSHLACVVEGGAIRLYLDGELVGTAVRGGPTTKTPAPVRIGQRDGIFHYRGWIRDVRLWKVARTQEQIRRAMVDGITGREEGLVAWYPLELDVKDYGVKALPPPIVETFGGPGTNALLRPTTDSGHTWRNVTDSANAPITVLDGKGRLPGGYGSRALILAATEKRVRFTLHDDVGGEWANGGLFFVGLSGNAAMTEDDFVYLYRTQTVGYQKRAGVTTPIATIARPQGVFPQRVEVETQRGLMILRIDDVERGRWASTPGKGDRIVSFGSSGVDLSFVIDDLRVDALDVAGLDGSVVAGARSQLALR